MIVDHAVKFPTGALLNETIAKFKSLSRLKMCGGSLDGYFYEDSKVHRLGRFLLVLKEL